MINVLPKHLKAATALFVLVVFWSCLTAAQNTPPPRFEHFTTEEGLPNNTVRSVIQDQFGFLWFTTFGGLVRYDGYDWKIFSPVPGDSTSIGGPITDALLEDSRGFIWVGTFFNGLSRYDPATESFTNFRNDPDDPSSAPGHHALKITEDDQGNIWVAWTKAGVSRIDPAGPTFTNYSTSNDSPVVLPSNRASSVLVDTEGKVWVGLLDKGIFRIDLKTGKGRGFQHQDGVASSLASDRVLDLIQGPGGNIWISSFGGLSLWNPTTSSFINRKPDQGDGNETFSHLMKMSLDRFGQLWIGSEVGLYSFNPVRNEFFLHPFDKSNPETSVLGPVFSACIDRSGIIWAGSWYGGLNKYDPSATRFQVQRHDPNDPVSLDDDKINCIFEDSRGYFWVGTGSEGPQRSQGGLNYRRPGSLDFESVVFPDRNVRVVTAIDEDPEGLLWLGTNVGIWSFRPGTSEPVRLTGDRPGFREMEDHYIRALMVDSLGNLFAGTRGKALIYLNILTDEFVILPIDLSDATALSGDVILIFEDSRNRIWVGTDRNGLSLFNPVDHSFERFLATNSGISSIADMIEHPDGSFWIGTYAGLVNFHPEKGIIGIVDMAQGLPSNLVGAILKDEAGRLWLSTGKGLLRFDPATGSFKSYSRLDGLPDNGLCRAHFCSPDGIMYFGGSKGFFSFRPGLVEDRSFQPPVVLTSFHLYDKPTGIGGHSPLQQSITLAQQAVLDHDQNDISLTFSALDFSRPENNRYRYRLENYDLDWRSSDSLRKAVYTNLSPGHYSFIVQGSNSDGIWNQDQLSFAITINKPWWKTNWALAIYYTLMAIILFVGSRMIIARERIRHTLELREAETLRLQELDQMKSSFFANISHEFRTPLTLIEGPLHQLLAEPESGSVETFSLMGRNTRRLRQLIDQLLDLSRLEAKRLPIYWKKGDSIAFLKVLASSFHSMATDRDITFNTGFSPDSGEGWFDPDLLEKVVTNLLSNAFKFTPPKGVITVQVQAGSGISDLSIPVPATSGQRQNLRGTRLEIIVANTGSFISPEEQDRIFDRFYQMAAHPERGEVGSGIGLALVKELVAIQGGSIRIESHEEGETRFIVTIPILADCPPGAEPGARVDPLLSHRLQANLDLEPILDTDPDLEPSDEESEQDPLMLIVEDHPDLRAFLRKHFAPRFRIIEAEDGAEGLESAFSEIPDIILSDVMMPRVDGFELCGRIKEDERTSHIPVVLLTARADAESIKGGLRIGADDYLAKPFDPEELSLRVNNLIEMRINLQKRYSQFSTTLDRSTLTIESPDDKFLSRLADTILENLEDPDFNVETLSREAGMSRMTLHRKLTSLTGQPTSRFIRDIRLQKAAQMLSSGYGNVTEVAYSTGFKHLSHFSKNFREMFGVAPSQYPPADPDKSTNNSPGQKPGAEDKVD